MGRSMGRGTVPVPRATGRRPYAGVVATEGSVESLPLALTGCFARDLVRERNSIPIGGSAFEPHEAGRQALW